MTSSLTFWLFAVVCLVAGIVFVGAARAFSPAEDLALAENGTWTLPYQRPYPRTGQLRLQSELLSYLCILFFLFFNFLLFLYIGILFLPLLRLAGAFFVAVIFFSATFFPSFPFAAAFEAGVVGTSGSLLIVKGVNFPALPELILSVFLGRTSGWGWRRIFRRRCPVEPA